MARSYKVSKFNATKHGILSKYILLPWENVEEYNSLHQALIDEHTPDGPTEAHLVEELAGIIWRKRRLRLAENASFTKSRYNEFRINGEVHIKAVIEAKEISSDKLPTRADNSDVKVDLKVINENINSVYVALEILSTKDSKSYKKAFKSLDQDVLSMWNSVTEAERYEISTDGLEKFLSNEVLPNYHSQIACSSNYDSINKQINGASMNTVDLPKFGKYEAGLDRKMQKILSMLLKLQEMRRRRQPI